MEPSGGLGIMIGPFLTILACIKENPSERSGQRPQLNRRAKKQFDGYRRGE